MHYITLMKDSHTRSTLQPSKHQFSYVCLHDINIKSIEVYTGLCIHTSNSRMAPSTPTIS